MSGEEEWAQVNPIERFHEWLRQAEASEPNDPNAAALATSTANGEPSVRMVLVKRVDERGFCFFTNAESPKGRQLAENPRAALCFHWKTLRRQVRVDGTSHGTRRQRSRRLLPHPLAQQPDKRCGLSAEPPAPEPRGVGRKGEGICRATSGRDTEASALARLLCFRRADRVLDGRRRPAA